MAASWVVAALGAPVTASWVVAGSAPVACVAMAVTVTTAGAGGGAKAAQSIDRALGQFYLFGQLLDEQGTLTRR
nr:hypothetical protein KPHV_73430 [Kitasatospora purpeofusca]